MTSTPNGRLFLYRWVGGDGQLFCSNLFDASKAEAPQVFPVINGYAEHAVGDAQNGYRLLFNGDGNIISYDETVNGKHMQPPPDPALMLQKVNSIGDPSISRVSIDGTTSRVRVSLRQLNEHLRSTYVIIDFGVVDKDRFPSIEPGAFKVVGKIAAADATYHSVLRGTFIDPDYVNVPPGFVSNAALFYWLEWPAFWGQSAKAGSRPLPQDACARYCFFSGWPTKQSGVGALSVKNGELRSWSSADPGGDYLTGGFFYSKGMNYVAQWREPDGIRANIVKVSDPIQPHVGQT